MIQREGQQGGEVRDKDMVKEREYLGIVGLILIALFLTADQAALVPNYLLIEAEFGVSHTQMGAISSVFIVVGALMVLLWGYWADKYSRKKLLVMGTLLGEIPCFLTAFVQSYNQLFIMRALTGLGIGILLPVGSSLLGDYFPPEKRGKGFAWFLFAAGLGYLMGAAIAGTVGPRFNWRYPFAIIALPNFIIIPLFYFLAKEPERGGVEPALRGLIKRGLTYDYKAKLSDFKRAISIRTNLFLNLQSIAGCIPWGVLPIWVITFFVQEKGLTIPMATFFGLAFGGARIVGNIYGGYLGDFLRKKNILWRTILCIATILGAIPFIAVVIGYPAPADPRFLPILLPLLLGFVGISLASIAGPNIRAIFLDVNVPENRGIMLSVANITDVMGGGIGPLLGGILADKFGLTFVLYLSILFWIPSAFLWLPLIKTIPNDMHNLSLIMRKRASKISAQK